MGDKWNFADRQSGLRLLQLAQDSKRRGIIIEVKNIVHASDDIDTVRAKKAPGVVRRAYASNFSVTVV